MNGTYNIDIVYSVGTKANTYMYVTAYIRTEPYAPPDV
jgi:hypothetical protein